MQAAPGARAIYALTLIVACPVLLLTAGYYVFEMNSPVGWLCLLPLVLLTAQLIWPTVIGWWLCLGLIVLYTLGYSYYWIRGTVEQQWRSDLSGYSMGTLVVLGLWSGVAGMLWYRPRGVLRRTRGDNGSD